MLLVMRTFVLPSLRDDSLAVHLAVVLAELRVGLEVRRVSVTAPRSTGVSEKTSRRSNWSSSLRLAARVDTVRVNEGL